MHTLDRLTADYMPVYIYIEYYIELISKTCLNRKCTRVCRRERIINIDLFKGLFVFSLKVRETNYNQLTCVEHKRCESSPACVLRAQGYSCACYAHRRETPVIKSCISQQLRSV